MDANALFTMALGLTSPWEVKDLVFTAESRRLDIRIDFPRGASFPCPECGESSKVHDTEEKSWRHLDFFQHSAYLTARVPRCRCDQHGVKQVQVPWARPGSGFTLLFEALLMALMREMPVNAVARLVGEHDTRLWRLVDHHVEEARQRLDMSQVKAVAVDETAARRGQDYVSLFMDLDRRRLLFGTEGNDQSTVEAFRKDLEAHGGSAERITEACCDMSQAFILGLRTQFPNAHLTFDRFHVMQLANKAVDDVRRVEARDRPELKRSRYVWLKNRSNLSFRQRERLQELQSMNLQTAEAYRMRLTLQDFYEQANPKAAAEFLADWCEMVLEAGLEPMKKVARTLMEHADGVLHWFWSGFSNGLLEGINSLIQAAKAKARGYRTTRNLLNIAYLIAGKLDFALPVR
ncbi:ISL3 family transposase [Geothrix fermentans]|uniref:ISL3 family transposase n=7 Tax=Geothrix fermentans TaxID=44676 RepID=UPI000478AF76|nr:ISL3 family transposase [Geothrix fermentans]